MVVKYDTCSDRIKKHIDNSPILSVRSGNVTLHNKYCSAEMIVNQLVHEGVITTDELMKLLQS